MNLRPWEIWKAKPPGFETAHWFILISPSERLQSPFCLAINALACFTLRGQPEITEARLNAADGFERPTVCQCDLIYTLEKRALTEHLSLVCWERQQAIKARLREVLRPLVIQDELPTSNLLP